jgi:uncharacterized protein YueI
MLVSEATQISDIYIILAFKETIDKENIEPLPEDVQEGRFKVVTDEDTDQILRDNMNKNTNYKIGHTHFY